MQHWQLKKLEQIEAQNKPNFMCRYVLLSQAQPQILFSMLLLYCRNCKASKNRYIKKQIDISKLYFSWSLFTHCVNFICILTNLSTQHKNYSKICSIATLCVDMQLYVQICPIVTGSATDIVFNVIIVLQNCKASKNRYIKRFHNILMDTVILLWMIITAQHFEQYIHSNTALISNSLKFVQ